MSHNNIEQCGKYLGNYCTMCNRGDDCVECLELVCEDCSPGDCEICGDPVCADCKPKHDCVGEEE